MAVDAQLGPPLQVPSRPADELWLQFIPGGQNPLAENPQVVRVWVDLDLVSSFKQ